MEARNVLELVKHSIKSGNINASSVTVQSWYIVQGEPLPSLEVGEDTTKWFSN